MDKKEFYDYWRITYNEDNNGYDEFIKAIDKLVHEKYIKLRHIILHDEVDNAIDILYDELGIEKRYVISSNDNFNDVKTKFSKYIKQITNSNSNTLVITDPYILVGDNAYINKVYEILCLSSVNTIKLIIPQKNYRIKNFNLLGSLLSHNNKKIEVIFNNSYHDRFWITNTGCFICGCSLNGILRKLTVLTKLQTNDFIQVYKNICNVTSF